jgi:membrane associated rhomboid family serine protease
MAFNLALMIFAVYLAVFARDLFLNASPGIDAFAHTAGFLIGFALSPALPAQRTLQLAVSGLLGRSIVILFLPLLSKIARIAN